MQNRYTGDIGDFGKYAMLKALVGDDLRLGVAWYLNPDEEGNTDGGFVAYPRLEECDPQLHDSLSDLVARGDRRVAAVEAAAPLPEQTIFHSAPLTFRDLATFATAARRERSYCWRRDALATTANADVVFMDPDNGLEDGRR
jgi:hypothetical protein